MNPYSYLDSLTENITSQIECCDKADKSILDTKIFTQRDYLNKISGFVSSLRGIVDNSFYEVEGAKYDGDVIEVKGLECKRTEIEDIILIQPLSIMTAQEYSEIMDTVSQIYDKGALNNKMVLVLPYDVRFLKAKIKKQED